MEQNRQMRRARDRKRGRPAKHAPKVSRLLAEVFARAGIPCDLVPGSYRDVVSK